MGKKIKKEQNRKEKIRYKKQEVKMNKNTNHACIRALSFCVLIIMSVLNFAGAVHAQASLDTTISAEDKAKFDEILTPVEKIYNFIKYAASLVAVIALLFAGISYMFSGNDIRKRDTAKNMATYVVIGLVVIWAAPFVVNLLIA